MEYILPVSDAATTMLAAEELEEGEMGLVVYYSAVGWELRITSALVSPLAHYRDWSGWFV